MSSFSTACFVHKKTSKIKSRKSPKKASKHAIGVSDKRNERLNKFTALWDDVAQTIESAQLSVYTEVVEDCVRYVQKASDQLVRNGNRDGEIPTAVLITGVNMPDHDTAFTTLRDSIRGSVSPFVVSLDSANEADAVKTAIQKVVSTLVADVHDEEAALPKMKSTMPTLVAWYRDAVSRAGGSTSPRKTKEHSGSPKKRRKSAKPQPIVVIFEDFESVAPAVAQDFILICSEYAKELPLIFVFGVSTSSSAVHKVLSQSALSKLAVETFVARRSSDLLNIVVNEVLLTTRFPFKMSGRLFKFFEDIFLFNDLSVKTFVNGLKFCLMEYFYESPLSAVCCDSRELSAEIDRLDAESVDEFRKLRSFRTYVDQLPLKEQKALLLDDVHLKDVLESKLEDLREYHKSFFPVLRFVHALCKDLPKNILGQQLRELYSLSLDTDIGESDEFSECAKMLRMMSKDDLLDKVRGALTACSRPRPPRGGAGGGILVQLTKDVQAVVAKLQEMKGKITREATNEVVLQQCPKDVSKAKKFPSAFELLRDELVSVIESYVTKYLKNYKSFPFHEVAYVDVLKAAKSELLGNHRGALQAALEHPGRYLKCDCCRAESERGKSTESLPDVCVAYRLHAEYARLINLSDWLQSFNSLVCPSDSGDSSDVVCQNQETIARFFHSVAELQFLGFVKPAAQGKTDHVVRLTF